MNDVDWNLLEPRLIKQAQQDSIVQLLAGAVIVRHGKLLVVRRKPNDFLGGKWEFPSGKLETGETIQNALLRETREETGLDIHQVIAYLGFFDYWNAKGNRSRQFMFIVKTRPGRVQLSEHDAFQWIHSSDFEKNRFDFVTRRFLKKGFRVFQQFECHAKSVRRFQYGGSAHR